MLRRYIGLILSFAFRRTTPAIDGLQAIAASALPAIAKFAGVPMPANVSNDALAYIGLAAVAFVTLRLVSAPYFVWREQVAEIGNMQEELSKPLRLELHRMAEIRADAKADLAILLNQMMFLSLKRNKTRDEAALAKMVTKGVALFGRANVSPVFSNGFVAFSRFCFNFQESSKSDNDADLAGKAAEAAKALEDYLHGNITSESLERRLPPNIELEIQP